MWTPEQTRTLTVFDLLPILCKRPPNEQAPITSASEYHAAEKAERRAAEQW
jgi:hypothetical protein